MIKLKVDDLCQIQNIASNLEAARQDYKHNKIKTNSGEEIDFSQFLKWALENEDIIMLMSAIIEKGGGLIND